MESRRADPQGHLYPTATRTRLLIDVYREWWQHEARYARRPEKVLVTPQVQDWLWQIEDLAVGQGLLGSRPISLFGAEVVVMADVDKVMDLRPRALYERQQAKRDRDELRRARERAATNALALYAMRQERRLSAAREQEASSGRPGLLRRWLLGLPGLRRGR